MDPEIVLLRSSMKGYGFNTAHPFWALAEARELFAKITHSRAHEIFLGGKRPKETEIAALKACFPEGIATLLEAQPKKPATSAAKPRKAGKPPNFRRKKSLLRTHASSCLDTAHRGVFFSSPSPFDVGRPTETAFSGSIRTSSLRRRKIHAPRNAKSRQPTS